MPPMKAAGTPARAGAPGRRVGGRDSSFSSDAAEWANVVRAVKERTKP